MGGDVDAVFSGMLYRILLIALLISSNAFAQKMQLRSVETKTIASFRGLSVINDSVAWLSGSNGWVGITTNGGKDWAFGKVKGYEKSDFRSIYAFDAKHAVIANAGSPAYVLRTTDGGASWQNVYENTDTAAFIDGMDFRDAKHGVIYGDPINGRMLMLGTSDGGNTWTELPMEQRPVMNAGEASFAASGTSIKYLPDGDIMIATGGKVSRLLITENEGKTWRSVSTPILQGEASTGIFSFLPLDKTYWIIAGGDYKRDTLRKDNLFYTDDGGKTWKAPVTSTRGYRECLADASGETIYAVGPGGIDVSYDKGVNWSALAYEKQFHVMKKARRGNLIILAGGGGKVEVLEVN
jgi:photosystem II stability/assembly factor-like uncharacterized protein